MLLEIFFTQIEYRRTDYKFRSTVGDFIVNQSAIHSDGILLYYKNPNRFNRLVIEPNTFKHTSKLSQYYYNSIR